MSDYATVTDIQVLKRALTFEEIQRADSLIPVVCDLIRAEAKKTGRDYDQLIHDDPLYATIAKAVVCDVVVRELNTPGDMLPATSYSEGAGSVSQSYSLPNASGAIKLWPSDLKALGLKRQKIGALNLMTPPQRGC